MDGKDDKNVLGAQGATEVDAAGSIDSQQLSHAAPKHTPGPWRIDFFETSARWPVIQAVRPDGADPEDNDIAELCGVVAIRKGEKWRPEVSASHVMANAHLIAASPDLYEALKSAPDIHDYIVDDGEDTMGVQIIRFSRDFSVWSQRAKAALAKAEEPS